MELEAVSGCQLTGAAKHLRTVVVSSASPLRLVKARGAQRMMVLVVYAPRCFVLGQEKNRIIDKELTQREGEGKGPI